MEQDRIISISRDGQLHYRIDKHATAQAAVVLLHGLSSNLTRWTEFLQHTTLRQRWSLLRVDLRGHGESRYRGKLTTRLWAEDVLQVLAAEHINRFVVVGHSLGARVAAELARQVPEQCLGTVLIDPVVPQALQGRGLVLYRYRGLMKLLAWLVRLANRLGIHRRHIPLRDLHELDKTTRALLARQSHESIARQYMSPRIDLAFNPLANYLQDLIETLSPFPDVLQGPVPMQVLLSSGGSISDLVRLEAYFRQGRHTRVEHLEADHWPLTEKPTETRLAIERAVETLTRL
ncbi:MAG: alpha/beta hydrolase [Gammaproteobacteria bacterium]